jgi:hypothetical protein
LNELASVQAQEMVGDVAMRINEGIRQKEVSLPIRLSSVLHSLALADASRTGSPAYESWRYKAA